MEYYVFDEKETGCGIYLKASNEKTAKLAFYAIMGHSPTTTKKIQNTIHLSKDLFRDAKEILKVWV